MTLNFECGVNGPFSKSSDYRTLYFQKFTVGHKKIYILRS